MLFWYFRTAFSMAERMLHLPHRSDRSIRLKPVLVGQFEFVEWTTDNHLRHA